MDNEREKKGRRYSILKISLVFAISVVVLSVLSGFGNRWGWWDFRKGFSILTFGFFGAIFTFFLTVVGIYAGPKQEFNQRFVLGTPLIALSLILILIPLNWMRLAKAVPRIHDITTDTETPPSFVAILPIRKDAPNSALYGGNKIAEQQKKGYPDLKPEMIFLDADHAFQKALRAAEEMGWKIVDANPSERRVEATDTTFWFGFKDDIVIRILPVMGASRLDIRSVSRVGLSDVGTNAKRIRNYLKKLREMKE